MESSEGGVKFMVKKLQKRFALSEKGAKDMIKGTIACAFQNIAFMLPVGLLLSLIHI